jgi:hypothetical protein
VADLSASHTHRHRRGFHQCDPDAFERIANRWAARSLGRSSQFRDWLKENWVRFVKMIPGCAAGVTAALQVQQAIDELGLAVNGRGVKVGVLSNSLNNLGGAADAEVTYLNCQKRPR